MKITSIYFLNDRQVASSSFECNTTPHSLAYLCPRCGEIWARIICVSEEFPAPHWAVSIVPCERHSPSCVADWGSIPGTLTDPFELSVNLSTLHWGRAIDKLPPDLLSREFHLLLNHYEKKLRGDPVTLPVLSSLS